MTTHPIVSDRRGELLAYLEGASGYSFQTRQDVDDFLHFRHRRTERVYLFLAVAWRVVLAVALAFAVFQYYSIDVSGQIMQIEKVKFLTPPPAPRSTNT